MSVTEIHLELCILYLAIIEKTLTVLYGCAQCKMNLLYNGMRLLESIS